MGISFDTDRATSTSEKMNPSQVPTRPKTYNPELEKDAMEWIKIFVPEFEIPSGMDAVHQALKDGVVLCKVMEALNDGEKVSFDESDSSFKHMENIGKFLDAAEKYGVNEVHLFQTIDLFEKLNMAGVISGLYALGRKAGSKGK